MPHTITLPTMPDGLLIWLLWLNITLMGWLWLRRALTPAKFLSIFETNGTLSARQMLAWVIALFGMCMRAAERMDNAGMGECFQWTLALFAVGGVVKAVAAVKPGTTNNVQGDVVAEHLNQNAKGE